MNDNEFKSMIKKEFDSVKAAPSARERILRELKGAGDMKERTKDNINISDRAEIKSSRSRVTALIAAAAAVAVGVGVFAVTAGRGAKRDDHVLPRTVISEEEDSVDDGSEPGADSSKEEQQGMAADNSPLGLPPAEGKRLLWSVNDETYFCPFIFDKNDGRFISADGRLEAIAFEGISTDDYPDTFGEDYDPETMKAIGLRITNLSGDTLNGMYFAGANVSAVLQETYPLELGYMIWSGVGVEEQGVFAELRPGMEVTVALAVPKDIGLSEITPRALIGEDGIRISYACLSEDYGRAEKLHHPADPDEWPPAQPSEDNDSDAEDSSLTEGVEAEDGGDVIKVNDRQVLIRLIRDGDTFNSVDGRFTAECYVKEGVPYVCWTNNTGTEQKGDYFGGSGISPYLVDNGSGPEVWYHYLGLENGVSATLGAFGSVTVEVPQPIAEGVTPRAVVKGSDGRDYIYINFDELAYNAMSLS